MGSAVGSEAWSSSTSGGRAGTGTAGRVGVGVTTTGAGAGAGTDALPAARVVTGTTRLVPVARPVRPCTACTVTK